METKTFKIDIKADLEESTDDVGIFSGKASVFGNIDEVGDIIHKGAFKKTTKENGTRALFFMHNTRDINNLMGSAVNLKEKGDFLDTRGEIDLEFKECQKAFKMVKNKVIDSLSIGYQVIKADYEEIKGRLIRNIREAKLFEISLIPIGMAANREAIITGVKNIDGVLKIIKDNSNDKEFVKKVISLLDSEPEDLITLIKSVKPDTLIEEPDDSITDEEHYENLVNILNGGK